MSNIITIIADKLLAARGLTSPSTDSIMDKNQSRKNDSMTRDELEIMADIAIESKYNITILPDEEKQDCNNIVIQDEGTR